MKIAVVMPLGTQQGGAEMMFRHFMADELARRICALVIFLEEGPLVEEVRQRGMTVEVIVTRRLRHVWHLRRTNRQIAHLLRAAKVDGVLSWMLKAHFYAGWGARAAGIPALWFQHGIAEGPLDRFGNLIPARGVLGSSMAICASQARLWPRRPVRLVYPGVDLERFLAATHEEPAKIRRRLGLAGDGPWIGMVGRLQRWKGMHYMVEAFSEVLRTYPEAQCLIVGGPHTGEPAYPDFLRSLVVRLGLQAQVHLVGAQADVPSWMQAMDVVVHASDHEPFGIVVVEAMALGKPVIASAGGGPLELIQHEGNGLLVAHGDTVSLAAAILRYFSDRQFAQAMGRAAQAAAERFSLKSYVRALAEAVDDLLARPRPTSGRREGRETPA